MSVTKNEITHILEVIRELYLSDEVPWVIGYSGGKDSTATVQLVWMALSELHGTERNHKTVHIISTDTLVESPIVAKWVEISLKRIELKAKEEELPFVAHKLIPDTNDTYWVNLLGRGYPYPRPTMRWCTDRLKIKPANAFIQNVVSTYGEVILLLGTRKAESVNRARSMQRYERARIREYLSPNGSLQNQLVFSPLEDWTNDDVWFFLMQYQNPWGHSNKELLTMYKGATADNECPLVVNTDTPSCGKSRFGCWMCTLVEKDKSMEAMIMNDSEKEWMTPLLEFRNMIANAELDRGRRDFRRMSGQLLLYKGRLVHGPYRREIREEWLETLLRIQKDVQIDGPKEFATLELITYEELKNIREIWVQEKHEFVDSLPKIYQRVFGVPFECATLENDGYGEHEWELIQSICNQVHPDEELLPQLVTGLISIEQQALEQQKRYGLQKVIESHVRRSFYRDEIDAHEYASERLQRKIEHGAAFDPKARTQDSAAILSNGSEGQE